MSERQLTDLVEGWNVGWPAAVPGEEYAIDVADDTDEDEAPQQVEPAAPPAPPAPSTPATCAHLCSDAGEEGRCARKRS
eukprot:g63495.t1